MNPMNLRFAQSDEYCDQNLDVSVQFAYLIDENDNNLYKLYRF